MEKKVAIITGAGRGIGRATALALAEAGADVVLVARSRRALEAVANEVRVRGGQVLAIPTDLSDPASVDLMVLQTLRASGRIDILINNADVLAPIGMAWEVPPLIWQRNININLGGAFLCTHTVLPHMINQDLVGDVRGKIIHVSSGAASQVVLGWSAYCAAMAGMDQFTRVLAAEVESHRITVNTAYPGVVDMQIQSEVQHSSAERPHQMGQLRPLEEVARFLLWLASPFTNRMTGQIIDIDDEAIRQRMADDLGDEPTSGGE